MRKILLSIFALFTVLLVWDALNEPIHGSSGGSPGGYSSAPSDGGATCTNCHGGSAVQTQSGLITTDIPGDGYVPGSTYTITLTGDFQGRTKYGFEMAANKGTNTNVGGFIHTTGNTRSVGSNATHTGGGNVAPSGSRTWTMSWKAPASGSGLVTFYAVVNATNSNSSSSGDQIIKTSLTVQEKPACIIADFAVRAAVDTICKGGTALIVVENSDPSLTYQLQLSSNSTNVGTAQAGTGGDLGLLTGTPNVTTDFKVIAEKSPTCSRTLGQQPTVTVLANPVPLISASGPLNICPGDSVTLTSSLASSYNWSNGKTTRSIVVKQAGDYSVTTANSKGCSSASAVKTVTLNPVPQPKINYPRFVQLCPGDEISLMLDESYSSYNWNDGSTASQIRVSANGDYFVTVQNQFGCTGNSDTVTVEIGAVLKPVITPNQDVVLCEGEFLFLNAGDFTKYNWSTGDTTKTIRISEPGKYAVSVTSQSGCSGNSDTLQVEHGEKPEVQLNLTGIVYGCDVVVVQASGNHFSYTWNNGAAGSTQNVTESGVYFVEAESDQGCVANSDTVILFMGTSPEVSATKDRDTLTASISERIQWYRDAFKIPGATLQKYVIGAEDGNYYCVATDQSGICKDTSEVFNINRVGISEIENNFSFFPNPTSDRLQLNIGSEGPYTIEIFSLPGDKVRVYSNLNGPFTVDVSNLPKGTYILALSKENRMIRKKFSILRND